MDWKMITNSHVQMDEVPSQCVGLFWKAYVCMCVLVACMSLVCNFKRCQHLSPDDIRPCLDKGAFYVPDVSSERYLTLSCPSSCLRPNTGGVMNRSLQATPLYSSRNMLSLFIDLGPGSPLNITVTSN